MQARKREQAAEEKLKQCVPHFSALAAASMAPLRIQLKPRRQQLADPPRRMAAQLARTEEAAKRILTRCDPSARGGTAAALLLVEGQLTESRQEVARLQHELAMWVWPVVLQDACVLAYCLAQRRITLGMWVALRAGASARRPTASARWLS